MRTPATTYNYLSAGLTVLAALAISKLAAHYFPIYHEHGIFTWYLLAVAFVAWRFGFWPAVFATVLSGFCFAWFFAPPAHSVRITNPVDLFRLSQFIILATLINSLQNARVRAERLRRATELRLALSLEAADVGAWEADIAQRVFWNSPNLPAIYGIHGDFATTYEGFFAYIYPEDRDFFRLATVSAGKDHSTFEITHRIVSDHGQIRHVTTRGRLHYGADGNITRMMGTVLAVDGVWTPPATNTPKSVKAASSDGHMVAGAAAMAN